MWYHINDPAVGCHPADMRNCSDFNFSKEIQSMPSTQDSGSSIQAINQKLDRLQKKIDLIADSI